MHYFVSDTSSNESVHATCYIIHDIIKMIHRLSHDKANNLSKNKCSMLILLAIALLFGSAKSALPQFSWDTLPVFFHSSNSSGQYNDDALKVIAKFQMVTIEKWMGWDVKGIDDEDEMVLAMMAIKKKNPAVATYFYMNSNRDRPEMTRMYREAAQKSYLLKDDNGQLVKTGGDFNVFDLTNPEMREWWLNICLNATKFADGDGCFCDMSASEDAHLKPQPSESIVKSWADGMMNLTQEVQEALGEDKLLIGKKANQSYVKSVQIEYFAPDNNSINSLILGAKVGQVMQAHVSINVSCTGDLTDYIAAFLIGAGEYAYFGCGNWFAEGDDTKPLTWRAEYDKSLGTPKGPAMYKDQVWTRSFLSGTIVMFDTKSNHGTINWS